MLPAVDDPWSDLGPREVRELLAPIPGDWWICGGWAIDLWLGQKTRAHGDFDVGCWLRDVPRILASLEGWRAYRAKDGMLLELSDGGSLDGGSVWLRRRGHRTWDIQLMPETTEAGRWLFRRDSRIARPTEEVTCQTRDGFQLLRPEIQLLYKAKDVRSRDEADFEVVTPRLPNDAKTWLATALRMVHPAHPWIGRLDNSEDT